MVTWTLNEHNINKNLILFSVVLILEVTIQF